MIINTGQRTDIPAFYSQWLSNRLKAGYVLVRNPFDPVQVTRYRLDPEVVDILAFCTKNPAPMFPHMEVLTPYRQFWFVTITPYGRDIEGNVPDKTIVLDAFRRLSAMVGRKALIWRYDPILLTQKYSIDFHLDSFRRMAQVLEGSTDQVVISFLDMYEKTRRNFPEGRALVKEERLQLGKSIADIGRQHGMVVRSCFEGTELAPFGVDVSGCMTKELLEAALDIRISAPHQNPVRPGCDCLMGNDIGAYNTCQHFCRYCYANYDRSTVHQNAVQHDPDSPLLIGHLQPEDRIHEARQKSWIDPQLMFPLS
jgi:hypothetical protein